MASAWHRQLLAYICRPPDDFTVMFSIGSNTRPFHRCSSLNSFSAHKTNQNWRSLPVSFTRWWDLSGLRWPGWVWEPVVLWVLMNPSISPFSFYYLDRVWVSRLMCWSLCLPTALSVILTFRRSRAPFWAFQLDCLRFKGPGKTLKIKIFAEKC